PSPASSSTPGSPPPEEKDFHKHFRAFALDFAYRNQRWRPSLIPVREIVQFCTILLVEIVARWGWDGGSARGEAGGEVLEDDLGAHQAMDRRAAATELVVL